jgi:LysM repeat protein
MDLTQLRQALRQFEQPAQQTLSIAAGAVPGGWTAVAALLRTELRGTTLAVSSITTFPPDPPTGTDIVYRGAATVLPWTSLAPQARLAVTLRFTVDAAGAPHLRIDALPPPGWTLGNSFDTLAERSVAAVAWETVSLLITSAPLRDPAYPAMVAPGVNISGTVRMEGPFALAGMLLSADGARTVAGHVDLTSDPIAVLDLRPLLAAPAALAAPGAGAGLTVEAGAQLRSWIRRYPGPSGGEISYPFDQVAVCGAIRLGATTVLPVRMPLVPGGYALALELDSDGDVPLDGLGALSALAPGADLGILPPELPEVSGFVLTGLSVGVDLGDGTAAPRRAQIAFDVALRTGGWAILPREILSLTEVGVQLNVAFGGAGGEPAVSGVIYGRVTIADQADLLAQLSLPVLDLSISLDDGRAIPVAAVMAQFINGLTGISYTPPVGGMQVVVLDIVAGVRSGLFQLAAQVDTDWSISFGSHNGGSLVSLGLDEVSLYLDYDGSVLAWEFGAVTHIGPADNPAQFALTARTAGRPEDGWDLGLALVPGSTIDVAGLLRAFLFPGGATPGEDYGVPALAVTALDLAVQLDPCNEPYAFDIAGRIEAGWSFTLFSTDERKIYVAAAAELHGKRPLAAGEGPADADWSTVGRVSGELSLFGLQVTVQYAFAADNTVLTFGIWYGQAGIEAVVTKRTVDGQPRRILTARLGDLSLGEILEFLIGLALPGESRRLPAPWDLLYDVNFKNLSLEVDLDSYQTSVTYAIDLRLGFMTVTSIGLRYVNTGGDSQVLLQLEGDFLGQRYGGPNGRPLEWNVLGDDAPAVPGKGPALVDIRYVALGQHVALPVPDAELKTVGDVMKAMKAAMTPPSSGSGPPPAAGLRYDAGTGWIFGLEATILDTLTLTGVFYDPHLYGAVIELAGERAGTLAGLRAELMYRRVNDQIGQFSVDLRVPDAMRNFDLGPVGVTLGLLHVDVFTNGDFRVDLGFPAGGDFARSFCVQVFPWIGQGGVYFGVLSGATSQRVPQIVNGTFAPVIEAGIGLYIGVGKQIRKGPLSAGLALQAVGIFEGVYAPFHPYDTALPKDTYYWVQGTAGIVGRLYGEVDFFVVKASVNIEAKAMATLTIEAHAPTNLELSLTVTARASIEVLFVTVHFSFDLKLEASFTFGGRTAAPWIAGPAPTHAIHAARPLVRGLSAPVAHPLRQQRAQSRRPRPGAAPAVPAVPRAAAPAPWAAVALYGAGTPKSATVQFLPALTVADPAQTGSNTVQVVLLLAAENTISPHARTAAEVREVATGHLHETDENGNPAFTAIVETMLRWAAREGANATGAGAVSGAQLAAILDALHDPVFVAATFDYGVLAELLHLSLNLVVRNTPPGTKPSQTSGTFLPFVPNLTVTATQGVGHETRDYTSVRPVSNAYTTNLAAYVEQLAAGALGDVAGDPLAPAGATDAARRAAALAAAESSGAAQTMAEALFGEAFALLARAAVQAAADYLAAVPYPYPGASGPSLTTIAGSFPAATVTHPVARGQTLAGVAASAGLAPHALDGAYPDGLPEDAVTVEVPAGVTPLGIATSNPAAPLLPVAFDVTGLGYQLRTATRSFNAIAAAVPQQVTAQDPKGTSGPLTGARIAAAASGRAGLLREGVTLTVPAFTYQRLAGDSDRLLACFFTVRNGGTGGVPRLDWYDQALVTLNPDATWAPGTTVQVPGGYQASAGPVPPVPYLLHDGDTRERVAATFALYQAGAPGPAPTVPTYAAGPYSHTVTSTTTLAGLAADFPGLALASLIAANTGAEVLAPLAVLTLPAFGAQATSGQTLRDLAALYDLELRDLVTLVAGVGGLYQQTTLSITGVPTRTVDQLVAAVAQGSAANAIAAQVSRFLLHGLRVPSPDDATFTSLSPAQVRDGAFASGTLLGLYDSAALQFPWTAPATVPLTLELTSTAQWLTLAAATAGEDGRLTTGDLMPSISVTLADAQPWTGYLPDTELTLNATAQQLALGATSPVHYELPATIHWQAARQPVIDGSNTARTAPGEPSLWPLPAALRALTSPPGPTPAFDVRQRAVDAPAGGEGASLSRWAWAIHVPFAVRQIPAAPPPGSDAGPRWLAGSYAVVGADAAGAELLYALWTYLQRQAANESATQLFLLRPPGQAGPAPAGLLSDPVDAGTVVLLKANVSTQTAPPVPEVSAALGGGGNGADSFSATLAQPLAFTTLLWEATVVRTGGFTLRYGAGDAALADSLFDASGAATLTLVCLLGSQTGTAPGRGLLAVNTCALVEDNVDASAAQLYAVQTGGTVPTTTAATVPPGTIGFTITRTNPEPPPGTAPTAMQRTQLLYNLFGFGSEAAGGFAQSNQGLPAGPTDPPGGGSGGNWNYTHTLPAARLAAVRTAQACAALPDPGRDPYAGVAPAAAITVALAAQDAFGNRAAATDAPRPLPLDVRYTDPLVAVGEYPGIALQHVVVRPAGAGAVPRLTLELALQAVAYLPAPGFSTAAALRTASAHALRYERAYWQARRADVSFAVTTTLVPGSAASPLPLNRASLAGFSGAAYVFTSQLAGLAPVRHTVAVGETLDGVCGSYSVTPTALLEDNADLDAGELFPVPVAVPQFERFKYAESLDAFAGRLGTTAAALLAEFGNGQVALPAGTVLAVSSRTVPADGTATLAQMAAAQGCAVGDLGTSNHGVTGLLADGVTWTVRGLEVTTGASTFDTLVSGFAAAGITTTPAELAVANAGLPGVFVASSPAKPVSFTVSTRVLATATMIAALVPSVFPTVADFLGANGATPGIVPPGTVFQVGLYTPAVPPPRGVSVRQYVQGTLGLSLAQFAVANAFPSPPRPLATGAVLLVPALLDPAALGACAHAVRTGQSLSAIADRYGTDAASLGRSNQDAEGIFAPGQPVSAGSQGPVTTTATDSLASLLARFTGPNPPTLLQLIEAVAPSATLLRPGAALIVPPPTVRAGSLEGLAAALGLDDPVLLGRCNAALDGFLDARASVTVDGRPVAVGPHGTLTSLYERAVHDRKTTFDAFLTSVKGAALLKAGATVILPPPSAAVGVDLPRVPAVTATISPLRVEVVVTRPADLIASGFAADGVVGVRRSPAPARTSGVPASYAAYAAALEAAYGGTLRVAAGLRGAGSELYIVRIDPAAAPATVAIRSVTLGAGTAYFALPPLCREPVSRSATVRGYASGAGDPLPGPGQPQLFQSVDVQAWASSALPLLDLALSAPYAVPAFGLTQAPNGRSVPFDRLVAAKKALAARISGQATEILGGAGDASAASGALEQLLDVSLSAGWEAAAVVQLPATVDATFSGGGEDRGAHRLAVKALPFAVALDETTTLGGLAAAHQVHVAAVADALGGTPNLLEEGVRLTVPGSARGWTIGAHDTLREGATVLGLELDALAVTFAGTAPLFRDGGSITVGAASTTVVAGDSLEAVSDRLAAGMASVALASQDVPALLTGSLYIDGVERRLDQPSSIATVAQVTGLSVTGLAEAIAGQAVLAPGAVVRALAALPDFSLSAGKISLDEADGTANLVLSLADPARYRRLVLDLELAATGVEYAIAAAPLTAAYETSKWLASVTPLTGRGAPLGALRGQLDIPIPLRAYPVPPRLLAQTAAATVPPSAPASITQTIAQAKAWTYQAVFETQPAAQDELWLTVGWNYAPDTRQLELNAGTDPFTALAELVVSLPAVRRDLELLLLNPADLEEHPDQRARAVSAFTAVSLLAEKLAATWGPVSPQAATGAGEDPLVPEATVGLRLETRVRSASADTQIVDAFVLHRVAGTSWGPQGVRPQLGYVADDGTFVLLDAVVGDESALLFVPGHDHPLQAFARQTVTLAYPALDATVIQNARSSAWLTRNARLVPGRDTAAPFVYRTAETHFAALAVPSLVTTATITIGSGSLDGLTAATRTAFAALLGSTPASARTAENLTARFGYQLAPPGEDGSAAIDMFSPVVFRPAFAYTTDVPAELTAAIQEWIQANSPAPGTQQLVSLEVVVFSGTVPARPDPIVTLGRLDYAVTG